MYTYIYMYIYIYIYISLFSPSPWLLVSALDALFSARLLERLAGARAPLWLQPPVGGRAEARAQLPQEVQLPTPPPYHDMYDKPV